MSIISTINNIKPINSSSISSIIDVSNNNFEKIQESFLSFLDKIDFNESEESINIDKISTSELTLGKKVQLIINSDIMFSVDEQGRLSCSSMLAEVGEVKRMRFTDFSDYPEFGIIGEVVYTESEDDFIGYTHSGWKSLTASYHEVTNSIDTTNDTATTIHSLNISDNSAAVIKFTIIGKKDDNITVAGYVGWILVRKKTGSDVVIQGIIKEPIESDNSWNLDFSVSGHIVNFNVIGKNATNIKWGIYVEVKTLLE